MSLIPSDCTAVLRRGHSVAAAEGDLEWDAWRPRARRCVGPRCQETPQLRANASRQRSDRTAWVKGDGGQGAPAQVDADLFIPQLESSREPGSRDLPLNVPASWGLDQELGCGHTSSRLRCRCPGGLPSSPGFHCISKGLFRSVQDPGSGPWEHLE